MRCRRRILACYCRRGTRFRPYGTGGPTACAPLHRRGTENGPHLPHRIKAGVLWPVLDSQPILRTPHVKYFAQSSDSSVSCDCLSSLVPLRRHPEPACRRAAGEGHPVARFATGNSSSALTPLARHSGPACRVGRDLSPPPLHHSTVRSPHFTVILRAAKDISRRTLTRGIRPHPRARPHSSSPSFRACLPVGRRSRGICFFFSFTPLTPRAYPEPTPSPSAAERRAKNLSGKL
jgi:hypothetical protein